MRTTIFALGVGVVSLAGCVAEPERDADVPELADVGPSLQAKKPSTPKPVTYWVDGNVERGGSGSSTKPFRTINEALAKADAVAAPSVTVEIRDASYYEEVDVKRPTTLHGTSTIGVQIFGSISNYSGQPLRVERLTVSHPTRVGGVVSVNSPAVISDVFIVAARRYGIFQHGASLTVSNTWIGSTWASSEEWDFRTGELVPTGIGLYANHGAQVTVSETTFSGDGQAFRADDSRRFDPITLYQPTQVRFLPKVRIGGSKAVAPGRTLPAAVEVIGSASLVSDGGGVADALVLEDNIGMGVLGAGDAFSIVLRDFSCYRQRAVTLPGPQGPYDYGVCVILHNGAGSIALQRFFLEGWLDGIKRSPSGIGWFGGSMTATEGLVQNFYWGAALGSGLDYRQITNRVEYRWNDVNINTDSLILPPAPVLPPD